MEANFDYGSEVRVTRNIRNDGTYPGEDVGRLLIRRGEVGVVHDVGTYLQDQIIYRVNFFKSGKTVGCREEELIFADDPWVENKYEFREKAKLNRDIVLGDTTFGKNGDVGEIIKVMRDVDKQLVLYHFRVNGKTIQVPEVCLDPNEITEEASA